MNRRLWCVITVLSVVALVFVMSTNYKDLLVRKLGGRKGLRRIRQYGIRNEDKLNRELYDGVESFLMFIGYPRSGHTLVSSLLDAHPNALVANEFDVIGGWQKWTKTNRNKYYLFDQLYLNSKMEADTGYRSATVPHRFNYSVPGQWQGTFNQKILVMGAKKGGHTTRRLMKRENLKVLKEIHQVLKLPMKFLHVIRNPYDNIATMMLRDLKKRPDAGEKINDTDNLDKQIAKYMALAAKNNQLKKVLPGEVHEIHSSELIKEPKKILLGICHFLHLTCYQKYIEDCSKRIYPEASKTRYNVIWTDQQKETVRKELQRFQSTRGYGFDD